MGQSQDSGTVASIEKVTIRWNEDPLASVQALQNGELDMISPQSSPDVLQALEGLEGVTVETGVEATYEHVDLTYNNGGPFDPKTYGGDAEKAKAVPHVLSFDTELVLDARSRALVEQVYSAGPGPRPTEVAADA